MKKEIKSKRKQLGLMAKGKVGFNKLISKIFKAEVSVESDFGNQTEKEQFYEFSELDQKTKNALEFLANNDNYQTINDKTTRLIFDRNKLVKFSGMFRPHIKGDTYSQRLANYEGMKNISWSGKCGDVQLFLYTGKNSLISNTPIHPALESSNGKIFIEGFGLYSKHTGMKLTIIPILFGTQIKNYK
ncbi:hypothetical protein [Algoriphagus pacificus]|uniref:Uncharacterized protein n=1 Tax=Algoriphagus pacificus TaxID=2811234 RepID=A0ABS3CMN2_9BACT|nr:hypothetical protein [Algoriphagus pacificus]MBN7817784.1 hypothetical protein [Algoriphagus pacificus]